MIAVSLEMSDEPINCIGAFFVVRAKTLYHRSIETDGALNSSSNG